MQEGDWFSALHFCPVKPPSVALNHFQRTLKAGCESMQRIYGAIQYQIGKKKKKNRNLLRKECVAF